MTRCFTYVNHSRAKSSSYVASIDRLVPGCEIPDTNKTPCGNQFEACMANIDHKDDDGSTGCGIQMKG